MYGRMEAHALKFSMLIHLTRYPEETEIDTTTTVAACDYADFILNSYRRLVMEELTFTVNEHKLKKVSDLIKSQGEVSHRDVAIGTRYNKKELELLLQTLVDMGKIQASKGIKGGKWWKWTPWDL